MSPQAAAADSPPSRVLLSELHTGAQGVVEGVVDDDATLGEETGATIVMRLIELGFVAGERFEIIAEARPSGDPMAVRIGGSSFALRRREDASGHVRLDIRPKFKVGDPVRVLEGAFCDCLGIYEGMSDHERVGILLDLLGRKVRVRIDAEAIAAA